MPWTIQFYPYNKKETVGSAVAHFDDGASAFDFNGSVNLDDAASVADFLAQAKKALAALPASDTAQTNIDAKITAIETALNK